jgi:hypothetical protein
MGNRNCSNQGLWRLGLTASLCPRRSGSDLRVKTVAKVKVSHIFRPESAKDVESRMSKVTTVYYGFVIPKNKCVKKNDNASILAFDMHYS